MQTLTNKVTVSVDGQGDNALEFCKVWGDGLHSPFFIKSNYEKESHTEPKGKNKVSANSLEFCSPGTCMVQKTYGVLWSRLETIQ